MIIRIMGEGQYRLEGRALESLKTIDERLWQELARGNEKEYNRLFAEALSLVRSGSPVPVEEIVESELILPAPDTTLHEARRYFHLRM